MALRRAEEERRLREEEALKADLLARSASVYGHSIMVLRGYSARQYPHYRVPKYCEHSQHEHYRTLQYCQCSHFLSISPRGFLLATGSICAGLRVVVFFFPRSKRNIGLVSISGMFGFPAWNPTVPQGC